MNRVIRKTIIMILGFMLIFGVLSCQDEPVADDPFLTEMALGWGRNPYPNSTAPQGLIVYKDKLYFNGNDDSSIISELFVYDGISDPINMDLYPGPDGSTAYGFTIFNDTMYFFGHNDYPDNHYSYYGYIWEYDGENEPTIPFKDKQKNIDLVSSMTVYNDKLYFETDYEDFGPELWCYDLTKEPYMVTNLPKTGKYSSIAMVVYKDKLYFSPIEYDTDSPADNGLWIYDGVSEPAPAFLFASDGSGNPREFQIYKDKLYFSADNGVAGRELWVYDGVNEPTIVADIRAGSEGSDVWKFTVYKSELYFIADDGLHGYELWKYNGVDEPQRITDINSGIGNSLYRSSGNGRNIPFIEFNDNLYFCANDGVHGWELWTYNGVDDPTLVYDIYDEGSSKPGSFAVYKDTLYFRAYTFSNGSELYEYDGMGEPKMVIDLHPGVRWSNY